MVGATFLLPPELGDEIKNLIVADAFVALIRKATTSSSGRGAGASRPGGAILGLYNIADLTDRLNATGVNARLVNGTPLAVETIRRLACEAGILTGITDDHGAMLYLGRTTRLATPAQRHALQAMYTGCTNCNADWSWCHVHHIVPWDHGGPTDLDNLTPLCGARCHTLFHEGRWTMRSPRLGVIEIYTPDGRLHKQVNAHAPPRAA